MVEGERVDIEVEIGDLECFDGITGITTATLQLGHTHHPNHILLRPNQIAVPNDEFLGFD